MSRGIISAHGPSGSRGDRGLGGGVSRVLKNSARGIDKPASA